MKSHSNFRNRRVWNANSALQQNENYKIPLSYFVSQRPAFCIRLISAFLITSF